MIRNGAWFEDNGKEKRGTEARRIRDFIRLFWCGGGLVWGTTDCAVLCCAVVGHACG